MRFLILAHLAVTVPLALLLNIWKDEAFSLFTTSGTLAETLERSIRLELQPPVYFGLLWAWRQLDAAPLFARFFSVACVAAALVVVAALSRRFLPARSPAWLVGLVAFNPFTLFAALEIRIYALALLLTAVLLLCIHDAFVAERPSRYALLGVVASAVALVLTQYYAGFLLPAAAVGLVLTGRWERVRTYVLSMVAVALFLIPVGFWLPEQFDAHIGSVTERLSVLAAARDAAVRVEEYVLPIMRFQYELDVADTAAGRALHWLVRLVLAGLLVAGVRTGGGLRRLVAAPEVRWLGGTTATVGAVFVVLFMLMGPDLTQPRHTVALFLPVLLLPLLPLGRSARPGLLAGWVAIVTVCSVGAAAFIYRPLAKSDDSARVASYLRAHAAPGEPVLLFPNDLIVPLELYDHGPAPLAPLNEPPRLDRYEPWRMAVGDTVAGAAAIAAAVAAADSAERRAGRPTGGGAVWLFAKPQDRYLGIDLGWERLEAYLAGHYRTTEEARFHGGVIVRRLVPR
ncbi:MAG TPA: glycosyltransferase family 39 protein [Gemmatimonadales bacterium]|nr:glycosyltransferase family 39 protein [Gemmatimonadales bacterium]